MVQGQVTLPPGTLTRTWVMLLEGDVHCVWSQGVFRSSGGQAGSLLALWARKQN